MSHSWVPRNRSGPPCHQGCPGNPGPARDKGREGKKKGGDSSIGMKVEVGLRQGYRSRLPTGRTSVGSGTQGCPQIVSDLGR